MQTLLTFERIICAERKKCLFIFKNIMYYATNLRLKCKQIETPQLCELKSVDLQDQLFFSILRNLSLKDSFEIEWS